MRRFRTFLLVFVSLGVPGAAEIIHSEVWGYYLDIPDDLRFQEIANGGERLTLTDGIGLYQLSLFSGALDDWVGQHLAAWGTDPARVVRYGYNRRPAAFVEVQLSAEEGLYRGFVTWIQLEERVARLVALAPVDRFETTAPKLESFLDSFSATAAERFLPGPISQAAFPPASADRGLDWDGVRLERVVAAGWEEAEQAVIDREARVLASFPGRQPEQIVRAWSRFYRMIFRETRSRLELVADALKRLYEARGLDRRVWPATLLAELQAFAYERRGDASDIDASLRVLTRRSGDCDSLALVYLALLDHWGVSGILMVSQAYGHALAAVDLPGPGARFPFEGRQWLVAELTAQVALGQIDSAMADPRKWLGIDLKKRP